ncbi:MAG: hypothetical protein HY900_20700 [Deltaproteobacteria bacterium]|nr:hypothetical protein [Deltaproteobacteria bacterium]
MSVRPGMALYAGYGTNAALAEVLRQYRDTRPEFTLIMPALSVMATNLLHAGLVRKVITSYAGAGSYPGTGPSPVVQRLCRSKSVEIENWSLLSLTQRLMAGAFGLPFLPTRSIIGTSMAEENVGTFAFVEDPFDPGTRVGAVRALTPDIALMHGWASDADGYTITAPSTNSGKDVWGAKASRAGAVVTVERLVTSRFIRRYAALVTLPGHLVTSVCETPLGAHPEAMISVGLEGFKPYEHDSHFVREYKRASRDGGELDRWLDEWVFRCSRSAYAARLGDRRLASLRERKRFAVAKGGTGTQGAGRWNSTEVMLAMAAKEIEKAVLQFGFNILLTGVGTPALAAWLARNRLRRKGREVELVTGSGFIGYSPRAGDPFLFSAANLNTSKMITEPLDAHGVFAAGAWSRCLTVLSAAQVDRYGNLNSTVAADGDYLVGSGGANDAAAGPYVIALARQSVDTFVDRLRYVSTPGANVKTVVSDMAVYQKLNGVQELALTRYFGKEEGAPTDDAVERIRKKCGWALKVAFDLGRCPGPTPKQIAFLRSFDRDGALLK